MASYLYKRLYCLNKIFNLLKLFLFGRIFLADIAQIVNFLKEIGIYKNINIPHTFKINTALITIRCRKSYTGVIFNIVNNENLLFLPKMSNVDNELRK